MSHLLVANRTLGEETEAEPVIVNTDDPQTVVLELDNGERLELDRRELVAAIAEAV